MNLVRDSSIKPVTDTTRELNKIKQNYLQSCHKLDSKHNYKKQKFSEKQIALVY